ncbi:MAG: hypothetical protein JXB39_02505, partial [Deltaproteobacteria bacterium]|nr:hypothetical protein [Deltaproteobacteria bacterium]
MPDSPAVRRVAMTHPEVGSGELWLDPAGSVAAWLGRLPCHPPFARILPVDGPLGRGTFVEGGLDVSLAALPAPLPRAAALYVAQELAEDCARLHEAGGGHGAMSPRTLGWTRDGRLLVGPDPELMAAAAHAEGVQVRDCQAIGAALWCALGGVWPLPEEERNPARLLSPGLPRIVIDTLPRLCADDDRLELLLRGLLRWGGGYRMAPARAVRQAVSALRIRHAAAEEALAAYLANSHIRWRPREERPMPRYSPPPPEALPPPDDAAVAEAEAAPEPPEAEVVSEPEAEPARRTAEVESVAPPEPEPEPEAVAPPEPEPEPEAVPEPEALLEPEPEAVPEPEAEVE